MNAVSSARRFLALGAVLGLAACGGGSSSSTSPLAPATPVATATPGGGGAVYAAPLFHITIPARTSSDGTRPAFVSPATLSVQIALTADSIGIDPATLAGNPAVTNVNGTSGLDCTSGCTIAGPPSPVGNDTFTLTTYDATNAGGNALNTNSATFAIVQGVANNVNVTLQGIVHAITISSIGASSAGSSASSALVGPNGTGTKITAKDAAGQIITGTYANPITISDPDTNGDGTSVASSCPSYATGNPTVAPSSVQFTSDSSTATFCYGGLAEVPITLTASASGATSGTATFTPTLHAPVYLAGSNTPPSVVVVTGGVPDVQLFTTSGLGSTGSANFTENGWTNAPYDQTLGIAFDLTCSAGGPFSLYATAGAAFASSTTGTTFTIAALASPTAEGACPSAVSDGLTANPTHATAEMDASYTTSSFGVNHTTP